MEFQCPEDSAWYDVDLFCDGKKLTIHYANFSEEHNEEFDVKTFKNLEELEEFRRRFRQSSVQIQDHDCKLIHQGKTVCALCYVSNEEVKFYDAMVVEVLNEEHKFKEQFEEVEEEEEECGCTYVVAWQEGPFLGQRTFAKINDICFTPFSKEIDPSLQAFLSIARDRIEKGLVHEQPNPLYSPLSVEAFFKKLRRLRKNRYAFRTIKGRLLCGHRKKVQLLTSDEEDTSSTVSSL